MPEEAVANLACRPGGVYVDGTLGGAGHARAICGKIAPNGTLIGIDQDIDAITNARRILTRPDVRIQLFHGNFIDLPDYLGQAKIKAVHGILLDLGLSQHQLEASGRGFSFQKDEPLDMRMDVRGRIRAQDLLETLSEDKLSRLFHEYGEERWAARIARAVVAGRTKQPLRTSRQLADLVRSAVPAAAGRQRIHPATR
ncbi:MAG: 16S rRNA (cytosine(1402)-N(4))-methyltransferase RsmH, partial [Desulfosarcinaceae bacterium]